MEATKEVFIDVIPALLEKVKDEISGLDRAITLECLEIRQTKLSQLVDLQNSVEDIAKAIKLLTENTKKDFQNDFNSLSKMFEKTMSLFDNHEKKEEVVEKAAKKKEKRKPSPVSYSNVVANNIADASVVSQSPLPKQVSPKSPTKDIYISGFALSVIFIDNDKESKMHKGNLCYNVQNERIVVCINNIVLAGNVLNILQEWDKHTKFHEHRDSKNLDSAYGGFYVPPELNPMSKDRRNLTNRMVYIPSDKRPDEKNRYFIQIGSGDCLKQDVRNLTGQDARITQSLAMHWLLINMIAIGNRGDKILYQE